MEENVCMLAWLRPFPVRYVLVFFFFSLMRESARDEFSCGHGEGVSALLPYVRGASFGAAAFAREDKISRSSVGTTG